MAKTHMAARRRALRGLRVVRWGGPPEGGLCRSNRHVAAIFPRLSGCGSATCRASVEFRNQAVAKFGDAGRCSSQDQARNCRTGRFVPELGRHSPKSSQVWAISAELGQICPESANSGSTRPNLAEFHRIRPGVCRKWTEVCPETVSRGPNLPIGHEWPDVDKFVATSSHPARPVLPKALWPAKRMSSLTAPLPAGCHVLEFVWMCTAGLKLSGSLPLSLCLSFCRMSQPRRSDFDEDLVVGARMSATRSAFEVPIGLIADIGPRAGQRRNPSSWSPASCDVVFDAAANGPLELRGRRGGQGSAVHSGAQHRPLRPAGGQQAELALRPSWPPPLSTACLALRFWPPRQARGLA